MVCVTRFNPTTNGALHLGHVYTILVNETFARERGGKFYVRWNDIHQIALDGDVNIPEVREQMRVDIEWLGVQVDGWYSEIDMMPMVEKIWKRHGFEPPEYVDPVPVPLFASQAPGWLAYPYQPLLAAERSLLDAAMGVTHIIRGEELATDMNLHCWFCDLFGMPRPEFIYLPRVKGMWGDISKTNGGYTVSELRGDGWTPDEVRELLGRGCLLARANGWTMTNLKQRPRVAL